jgi:LuxR family maltose regulon positive regulatory protein
MSENITIAKITRPRLSAVLPRMRLFRLLDQSCYPITWVVGPAGSGKTTLVASYFDARKLPCLWYQVDEGDADIATFFYYMGLAAQKAAPRYRKRLPLLTPEYLQGLPAFNQKFFESLYNRLKHPFTIVFDNYQEVSEDSSLHEIVNNGLSLLPEGIQVFVLSRNQPPAAFMRLLANNTMHVVGWDELRFTLEESKQMMPLQSFIGRLRGGLPGWCF